LIFSTAGWRSSLILTPAKKQKTVFTLKILAMHSFDANVNLPIFLAGKYRLMCNGYIGDSSLSQTSNLETNAPSTGQFQLAIVHVVVSSNV